MQRLFGAALAVLALATVPAHASDLSRVERVVGREPAYQSKPQYCLLVFGPEADTRVWLVLDGDTLHVSNNIGELTGDGSRSVSPGSPNWFTAGDVPAVDGKTTYRNVRVQRYEDAFRVTANGGNRKCFQGAGFDPANKLLFADRAENAPIIHFAGPMEIGLSGARPTLQRGSTIALQLGIGTAGVGRGTFAAFQGCATADHEIHAAFEFAKAAAPDGKVTTSEAFDNRH